VVRAAALEGCATWCGRQRSRTAATWCGRQRSRAALRLRHAPAGL